MWSECCRVLLLLQLLVVFAHGEVSPLKKDNYRREAKGRRCCLGGRIYSIPCRVSYSILLWMIM